MFLSTLVESGHSRGNAVAPALPVALPPETGAPSSSARVGSAIWKVEPAASGLHKVIYTPMPAAMAARFAASTSSASGPVNRSLL
jgi:hypothetical protein